jgi:predicted nucleic acid-binding protein
VEIVCDSSVTLAWGLPDERSPEAERTLEKITGDGRLWVPALWWYEVANALTVAMRRRRIAEADSVALWDLYARLPVATDSGLDAACAFRIQGLATKHGLSAYDSAYLELAGRRRLPLATLDVRLRNAAAAIGISVLRG